ECNRCLAMDRLARSRDIAAWRTEQERWLRGAARVLVPSHDTAARLQQVWSTLEVQIAGHDQFNSAIFSSIKRAFNTPLRIIVLGQLSIAKGLNLLVECAQDAAQRQLPLEFHLLGEPLQPVPSSAEIPLFIHGAYLETELAARLHFLAPHLAWFPAQCPETWSYTLSACLAAGLPVVAPNLGAFPERLAMRADATLLPLGLSAAAINERLLQIVSPRQPDADAPTANWQLKNNNFFYQTDYLMPRNATPCWEPGTPLLAADLLIDRSERPRPFALWQSSGQPLADQLVRLRDANVALHGGLAERDAVISQQLADADRAWRELANHRDQMHTLLAHHRAELNDVIAQSRAEREELLAELNYLTAQHHSERTELKNEIASIYRSWSWQFTHPVRGLGRVLRATRADWVATLQRIWQRLPVPPTARYQLKSIAFRNAAPLFRGTAAYSAWLEQTRWAQSPQFTSPLPTNNTPIVKNLRIAGGVAAAPLVSIIIPVFNKLDYTLACLDSIAEQLPQVAIEVLVIDDHSSDDTERELNVRDDIRYLRNADNLGFVGSCNRAATEARGEFLFFLNNDTVVLSGWLDTLLQTFIDYPQAGLVGSKLIYPDGRLQEAGGIIWADGSGWNWGRLADPNAPEFNFLRDVDYCSGAA
ncbi:glycosyltransferase, partial [Chromatium okenii]|uniref:glycosyltransferase n=1 Tax=Chromatium okenii TaxID=61644 RepID=UPI0026F03D30